MSDDLVHDRANYGPDPCRWCGSSVSVLGFRQDEREAPGIPGHVPIRQCTNTECPTNSDREVSPP